MHVIMGFTIDEWAGIATIIGTTITAIYQFTIKPLLNRFDILSQSIDELTNNSKIEHKAIWAKINKQTVRLNHHDYEIGAAYREIGIEREEYQDEEIN